MLLDEYNAETLDVDDMYGQSALHLAAREGHLEIVDVLVEKIENSAKKTISRDKTDKEQTALHLATKYGRFDVAKKLILYEPYLKNCEDEDSNTPLHLACLYKKPKITECLLENGASLTARNIKKWTALDCASSVGDEECVKLLLEYDAPINPLDLAKQTPLHLAAQNGHPDVVTLLLQRGADISLEDHNNHNPLEVAIANRQRHGKYLFYYLKQFYMSLFHYSSRECIEAILRNRNWKIAMRTYYPLQDRFNNTIVETPLRQLIKNFPDLAKIVFDKCMYKVCTCLAQTEDCLICANNSYELDYEFLDDTFFWEHQGSSNVEHFAYSKKQLLDQRKREMYKEPYNKIPKSC